LGTLIFNIKFPTFKEPFPPRNLPTESGPPNGKGPQKELFLGTPLENYGNHFGAFQGKRE